MIWIVTATLLCGPWYEHPETGKPVQDCRVVIVGDAGEVDT